MTEQERKALRAKYQQEYMLLTGVPLVCLEKGIRPHHYHPRAKQYIVSITSEYTGIPVEDIMGKKRYPGYVKARQMICMFLHEIKMNRKNTADILCWDESTINYTLEVVKGYIEVDEGYDNEYKKYREYCKKKLGEMYAKRVKKKMKLDNNQVKAIRASKGKIAAKELGEIYGVSKTTILRVINNKQQVWVD